MILKVNEREFNDFFFNERYLIENKLEVYSCINYKEISEAREFLESVSSKDKVVIELLRDDRSSVVKYETQTSDVYKDIGISNEEFVVTLSYITSRN